MCISDRVQDYAVYQINVGICSTVKANSLQSKNRVHYPKVANKAVFGGALRRKLHQNNSVPIGILSLSLIHI